MIVAISGSVGSGKTTISRELGKKLGFEVVPLNVLAKYFKLNDVEELETFDFDLDKLLEKVEKDVKKARDENEDIIYEGHFAHFINPNLVDILFVINRDLKELKKEYGRRGYNEQKIKDNLEVEAFNLCFYEAIENGYGEEVEKVADIHKNLDKKNTVVYSINNSSSEDNLLNKLLKKIVII